ncbi:MAG: hypothetical protein GY938_18980 [Ketobacter sp.]|nr:hypothetical protein [Ketobacter sp.]
MEKTKAGITINACPSCGVEYEYHCYHDDMPVRAVPTPIKDAIKLLEATILEKEDRLGELRVVLRSYNERLNE